MQYHYLKGEIWPILTWEEKTVILPFSFILIKTPLKSTTQNSFPSTTVSVWSRQLQLDLEYMLCFVLLTKRVIMLSLSSLNSFLQETRTENQ